MRLIATAWVCWVSACALSGEDGVLPVETSQTRQAIAFGTLDTAHAAVVALVLDSGGGNYGVCGGSMVQVRNGLAYVLTAAHCCTPTAPSLVITGTDYAPALSQLGSGSPTPPAYAVVPGSVFYDAAYDGYTHDFCMLQVSGAAGTMATLALPSAAVDGVQVGVNVEHVGYGITPTDSNNSHRYHGTNAATAVDSQTLQFSVRGNVPGPCEGDSGGPVLLPAGAAPAQQTVVGVNAYASSPVCGLNDVAVAGRVSSVLGTGRFITEYLADAPIGNQVGGIPDCPSCENAAVTGACAAPATACNNDSACVNLVACLSTCGTPAACTACQDQAGATGVQEYSAYVQCICNTACTQQCATECGNSGGTDGGTGCGLTSADPACNTCLESQCCTQARTCTDDVACSSCLGPLPPASCTTVAAFSALMGCLGTSCATECNLSTSSSSSGSTGASSSADGSSSAAASGASSAQSTSTSGAASSATLSSSSAASGASSGSGALSSSGTATSGAGAQTSLGNPGSAGGDDDDDGGSKAPGCSGTRVPVGFPAWALGLLGLARLGWRRRR